MAHPVTLITGDGVGPELAEATRMCIDATGVGVEWDLQEAGVDVMQRLGTPVPDSVLESCRRTGVALKAPITTPVGTGFRSVNVYLRQALDLYACVRPCKQYPGVRTFFKESKVDIVLVRENTEDLYAGIEFEESKPETLELIADIKRLNGKAIRPDSGISIKPISITGSRRIVKYAFEYARKHGRKKSPPSTRPTSSSSQTVSISKSPARLPKSIPTSSSRIASSTTCACNSFKNPSCMTCLSYRTSTATSFPTLRRSHRRLGRRSRREHRRKGRRV